MSRTTSKTKTYINVAYKDRDLAKRLGAKWDPSVKRWYCPSDSTLALIYKWRKAPLVPAAGTSAPKLEANDSAATVRSRHVRQVRPVRSSGAAPTLFDGNLELPLAS